jgi:two-component system, NtrC family, sensor kinase
MRLSTRLLLSTLPIVVLVMSAFGAWFIIERERLVIPEVRQQTRAYARAMDIAFEYGLHDVDGSRIQAFLNRMSADPRVFGVIVYDTEGVVRYRSSGLADASPAPDSLLRDVLAGADEASFERRVRGRTVFAVLRSIREPEPDGTLDRDEGHGAILGALEVAQPYDLLLGEIRHTQLELVAVTAAMLIGLTIVLIVLTRRTVARPLERLVSAARALGEGDLDARAPTGLSAAEPNALAREFNLMAARLSSSHREQLRDAEERLQLERRLAEAEKLATVGTLAAGLAHEIGAPLNVISGRAEMLLKQHGEDPAISRHLQSIVAQIGRITRTVRSLLDYARRPSRRDEPVNLSRVIDHTIEMLETEIAKAGVTIERRESYEAWVRGDPDQLEQVLTNLFVNAMHAMEGQPGERVILVSVDAVKEHQSTASAEAVLSVVDTGPGLPEELNGRMFSPFSTTKPDGTGLGLVVARSIVQDHGGTLVGTNRGDGARGAEFTIRLALAAAPAVGDA